MDPEEAEAAPRSGSVPDDPALDRWLAELRTDAAARSRSRVGSLRARALEDATLVGVLADLRERGAVVVLSTIGGRRHRGEVLVVGADAVVLRAVPGEWAIVRLTAVSTVRPADGSTVPGEGSATTMSSFARILGAAAPPGARVRLQAGTESLAGAVVALSAQVAVVRLDNGDPTYVNLDAVDEALLFADDA